MRKEIKTKEPLSSVLIFSFPKIKHVFQIKSQSTASMKLSTYIHISPDYRQTKTSDWLRIQQESLDGQTHTQTDARTDRRMLPSTLSPSFVVDYDLDFRTPQYLHGHPAFIG